MDTERERERDEDVFIICVNIVPVLLCAALCAAVCRCMLLCAVYYCSYKNVVVFLSVLSILSFLFFVLKLMSLLEAKLQDHSDDIMEVTDGADKQLAIELKVR